MSMKPWQKRRKSEAPMKLTYEYGPIMHPLSFTANTSTSILLAEDQEIEVHSYALDEQVC